MNNMQFSFWLFCTFLISGEDRIAACPPSRDHCSPCQPIKRPCVQKTFTGCSTQRKMRKCVKFLTLCVLSSLPEPHHGRGGRRKEGRVCVRGVYVCLVWVSACHWLSRVKTHTHIHTWACTLMYTYTNTHTHMCVHMHPHTIHRHTQFNFILKLKFSNWLPRY